MHLKISSMYLAMLCTVSGLQVVRMLQSACPFHIFGLGHKKVKFWHLTAHITLHMCRQQVRGKVKPPYAEELSVSPDNILWSRVFTLSLFSARPKEDHMKPFFCHQLLFHSASHSSFKSTYQQYCTSLLFSPPQLYLQVLSPLRKQMFLIRTLPQ